MTGRFDHFTEEERVAIASGLAVIGIPLYGAVELGIMSREDMARLVNIVGPALLDEITNSVGLDAEEIREQAKIWDRKH